VNSLNRRTLLTASVGATLGAGLSLPAVAQVPDGCGTQPKTAPALQPPLLLTDWAWLAHYREANAKLLAAGTKVDVVFMGDSITEGWARNDTAFFSGAVVGRGISAQTTPQMLVRFHSDVIALKPRVVHLMAGTNDIAGNTGPMRAEDTQNNFRAMCEIAKSHGIRVALGASPPASKYWWKPEAQPRPQVLALNDWLRGYAKEIGATFADYAAVLSDGKGGVNLAYAKDEVHPTAEGYKAMLPVAQAAIR
jgi:lysophospholipase L1-like esterase